MVSITRKGYIELYYGDSLLSRHTALEEAFERALVHLAENQDTEGYTGLYRVKYPDREIDVSSILVKTNVRTPSAPQNFTAQATGSSNVSISWTRPVENSVYVAGYELEYSLDEQAWADVAGYSGGTSAAHTPLTAGTTYYYRVRAYTADLKYSPWTTTSATTETEASVRDDIIYEANFDTFGQDLFNPPLQSWSDQQRAVDGFRMRNIANGDYNVSDAVKALPHMEIKGGAHALEGERALLLTLYHPEHDPVVPYGTEYGSGTDLRMRMDGYTAAAFSVLMNTPRYQATKGLTDEFWYGLAIYFPPDFIFDKGVGSSLSFLTVGKADENAYFNLSHPSAGTNYWEIRFENWNANGSIYRIQHPTAANQAGTHNCWVFNFRGDTSGNTGFFRAWHNVVGQPPTQVANLSNIKYGPAVLDYFQLKAFASYKAGMLDAWNAGTYSGLWTDPNHKLVIGIDSVRVGGNLSNFRSVHPLQQEEPA